MDPTGHRLVQVRSPGSNPHPFVECKGETSALIASYLRQAHDHRPSRIDIARDMRAPGLFQRLHRLSKRIAKKHGVRWEPTGDWLTPDAGRTIYVGSRHSQTFIRIYEKGLKYAHDLGIPLTDELREWVRVEVEYKPQNPRSKSIARCITPDAIWGTAQWLQHFAAEAFSMNVQRINISQRRESDRDRALRAACTQYQRHLQSLFDDCGHDPAQFGTALIRLANLAGGEAAQAA
ncbi:replication initiation factor domain-containing protein [Sphingomonas sp. SM33]|uniref:Replication initiation factor domain-containing protein n=1 Tax=Sphingomonas telluris TaxID=2907998 RepID=A0ABS9VLJ8_9SPHN|nr:replication initiation factor domain-containing protein [Sphingomonas telluris]MCH8615379.1 replication initiation factor domain-containing protein [Sphingomonas telluris]